MTDVAVIGVPDERHGEVPRAYVVTTSGTGTWKPQYKTFFLLLKSILVDTKHALFMTLPRSEAWHHRATRGGPAVQLQAGGVLNCTVLYCTVLFCTVLQVVGGVVRVESIPKSAAGKILRKDLKAQFLETGV